MIRVFTILAFWMVVPLSVFPAHGQRPQGMGQMYLEVVTVPGGGLLGITDTGTIMRSLDGGRTFGELFDAPGTDLLYALAARSNVVVAAGTDGVFYRADLAVNPFAWSTNSLAIFGDVRGLAASAAGTWVGVGDAILQSADNGVTWTNATPGAFEAQNAVTWNAADDSWISAGGTFDAVIYRSPSGSNGLSWAASTVPVNAPGMLAVAADGQGNVLASGSSGGLLFSSDNGQTFAAVQDGLLSQELTSVIPVGTNDWIIGGGERTLYGLNAGVATQLIDQISGGDDVGDGLAIHGDALVIAGVDLVAVPVIQAATNTAPVPIEVTLTGVPDAEYFHSLDSMSVDVLYAGSFLVETSGTLYAAARVNGVYSPPVSDGFIVLGGIYPLVLALIGSNAQITQGSSADGINYQLQEIADLRNPLGWINAGSPQPGTGNPLVWIVPFEHRTRAFRTVAAP